VLQRARETVLGLFEHQDIPFMRVRRSIAPDFPSEGLALMSALPVELQYFHTGQETWAPGLAAIRSAGQEAADDLYFRGQLHPLSVTFLDDGASLWSELRYKADFYSESTIERLADGLAAVLDAVAQDPGLRVSELPVSPRA
jgi:hypothetical protein